MNLTRGKTRDPQTTRRALVAAALVEIEQRGYDGTDTNRIARLAGYSPQTFYRHYPDKLSIFVAVYADWVDDELHGIARLPKRASAAARALVAHHQTAQHVRRALRRLSLTDARVRAVRAAARQRQLVGLRAALPALRRVANAGLASGLLCVERLADAIVEGELTDLGLSRSAAERELGALLRRVLGLR
jgi:AcrR family transcriptional regulator